MRIFKCCDKILQDAFKELLHPAERERNMRGEKICHSPHVLEAITQF